MLETLWGLFCLAALLGFIVFAFRHALPFHYKTREGSETNKHSSYQSIETGSNWSSPQGGNHHEY
jgi:hypothetical protein